MNNKDSHLERYRTARDYYLPEIMAFDQVASDFSHTMFKMLFVLNAGGLLSLPGFAVFLKNNNSADALLAPAAAIFVVGLMMAFLCGLLTVANFRTIAVQKRSHQKVDICEANLASGISRGVSKNHLLELESALAIAQRASEQRFRILLPVTLWGSWLSGIGSVLIFFYGAATIGGNRNPISHMLQAYVP